MASKKKLPRLMWQRKPQTQVVPNRRALERKMACRKVEISPEDEAEIKEGLADLNVGRRIRAEDVWKELGI